MFDRTYVRDLSAAPVAASLAASLAASPRAESPLRLTRRGRLLLLAAALVAVAGLFWALSPSVLASSEAPTPTTTVTVAPGQTLWDIASDLRPTADVRETVDDIASLNELGETGVLSVGQEIQVPAV